MNTFTFPVTLKPVDPVRPLSTGRHVGELQAVLAKLKLKIAPSDLARKEAGASTVEAVRAFQARAGLSADGQLSAATVTALNAELTHTFVAHSKHRTQRLQEMLGQLGQQLDPAELKSRRFGPATEGALKAIQTKLGATADGRVTEQLFTRIGDEVLKNKLSSKTQIKQVQRTLLRALNIAKLRNVRVDTTELAHGKLGPSTQAAIKALQTRYGLKASGEIDSATNKLLVSIAVSIPEPVRLLKARGSAELKPLRKVARLNMQSDHVADLQSALTFLGYPVNEAEFRLKEFGKSTRAALLSYQKARGLTQDGHAAGTTLTRLNGDIARLAPPKGENQFAWRVRGSVRDERWNGVGGVTVQIYEKLISGQGPLLAERKTGANGFFDIPYDPPRDAATKQIRASFHLQIKALDSANVAIDSKLLFAPTQIAWTNFTQGKHPYRGTSEYAARMAALGKAIGNTKLADLSETAGDRQITHAAAAAGLVAEDVMRLVLALRVAARINQPSLDGAACYGFIAQNLPSTLPGDLINSTEDWSLIDQLVELAANGLVFMDDALKALAWDNAVVQNLMPIDTGLNKDAVLAALAQLQQRYVLEKPILAGNGNLKLLLDASAVDKAHYPLVADAFLKHHSFDEAFWNDVEARPADFGGAAALADLRNTIDIGHVTNNFAPMLTALKQKIADPNDQSLKGARDLAKLTEGDWVAFINANGGQVPANADALAAADKVQHYAAALVRQSERLFPAVALVATVARSASNPLANIKGVQALMDAHPDLDLRSSNLDIFVTQNNLLVDEATLTEARVLQRVHRIAPTASSGESLLEHRIHNSSQIVAMGKDRFVAKMTHDKKIDSRTALTVFGRAQHQYAQVLQRIADYRFDLHRANPKALLDHTYTKAELPPELAAIPNLATLFGSLDFCACGHCQSVYGPAAYLADVLRFLDQHPAEIANKTVKDILFQRRPDIGNIKLNCRNTETPLPYVDLVCEVLEQAMAAPVQTPNFAFQSTRSAAELRAAPEHVREAAYEKLRSADYPLDVAFDLWQEQARIFLDHLGVPRWSLMETFQRAAVEGPPPQAALPTDASIAAEYWGISSHEAGIIVATADATAARQKVFWGITSPALPTSLSVADFMLRSSLDYNGLLELLYVKWINPDNDPLNTLLERPEATCDTTLQRLVKLTPARLDKMHRFLRLRRHVPWAMWEIDLLIRSKAIGDGDLDERCLVRLQRFAQLQKRLGWPVDRTLALVAGINTEARVKPSEPTQSIPSLYESLFLNRAVINPVDTAFSLPIGAGVLISHANPNLDHRRTVLAAFELAPADFEPLQAKVPGNALNVANLSTIGRYAWLARALGMPVAELLAVESLSGVVNAFATPATLLAFIDSIDAIRASAFSVAELDYLLRLNPDSPIGLRTEVITQQLESMRDALRADGGNNPAGVIAGQLADTLGIVAEQAQLLLTKLKIGGSTLSQVLQAPALVAQDDEGHFINAIDMAGFPDLYLALRRLHKAALLVQRCKLDAANLGWLLDNGATFSFLQPDALPVAVAPAAPLFPAWRNLAQWSAFRELYPEPEGMSLRTVLDLAALPATPLPTIQAALATLTQWQSGEVDELRIALGLQHGGAKSPFAEIGTYMRLHQALRSARRIGASPARVAAWARRDDNTDEAQKRTALETRQAAKAKYDDVAWLSKVTPLEDTLREKKRDALIGYLVSDAVMTQNPEIIQGGKRYANPAYWASANDLLKYYLIDVEMCSCQLTSRIKQAISSVQMFVQRCLLGLEQPRVEVSRVELQDVASENSWKQWKWMKSYRIWEANRKVFLYPENWIEPELRDGKSPIFQELESEILQSDLTDANAQQAFLHYVEKVHEVARLDIVGTYHEIDDSDPYDHLPPNINLLHVIGRTRAQPAIYFYRKFDINYGEWSAWEKIDLDIHSEQVVPVVYNRRLYLFWLSFMEKPQKVKKVPGPPVGADGAPIAGSANSAEPPNQLELQLCWSGRKDGGWTSKKISHQKLFHPWQRPQHSYNLKPRYKSRENLLWLDVYISQSPEFNSTKFWDAYRSSNEYVTKRNPYDETARPWHSSSFVFDGDVLDVRMKPLSGKYHVLDNAGIANEDVTFTDSLTYVHANFGAHGRAIKTLSGAYEIAPRLPLPDGMRYHNTKLVNNRRVNTTRANVLEHGQPLTLLAGARSPFAIVASQHSIVFDTANFGEVPFFYQDEYKAFFVRPQWQQVMQGYNQTLQVHKYNFFPFYHPYTALFMRELNRSGLDGLLNRRLQTAPQDYYPKNSFDFNSYAPTAASVPDTSVKNDRVDFERYGAYALYNWEIFFHAPLMIACKLSQNQRFEEAMRWFHYIFDPTNTESPDVPQRYWITRPFFEQSSDAYRKQRIDNLLRNIDQHQDELKAWKNDPFKPHLIARYRPVAYQKNVVMKYIDNLVAWGDQLFRRDTIEAINEATTLYVLAYELLGRRPVKVPNVDRADKSYNELVADGALDPFGNKQVDVLMENFIGTPVRVTRTDNGTPPLPTLNVFYFGIPNNDRLLGYWDTVEDRLFKIRHCMNFQGVVRQLPLFEPPIDPALLVKAAAAGVDLSSVLSDQGVGPAPYRFQQLNQVALQFCGEVRALGDKLLAALEKYDAEGVQLLRSSQEITMQRAVREVRKQQVQEALDSSAALEVGREMVLQRKDYYDSRDFMNPWEITSMALSGASALIQGSLSVGYILAGALAFIPKITGGVSGFGASPVVTVDPVDGKNFAEGAGHALAAINAIMSTLDRTGAMASTVGGYWRRKDEWVFQGQLATTEIAQIDKQIAASKVRIAIAEREFDNQVLQIENSQAMDEYMRSKYTNQQLYDWQVRQLTSVYFQSYQLAYDMAKRAEKCYQYERGEQASSFVQFGYWDSLKKGLLAGERLGSDLHRMEAAYLEHNNRELEISKNISLAQLFPLSLLALKEAGSCSITLPEWLFDMDYPGHYFRRIKSVSLSIPSVVGPYTSINCTLSLINNGIRVSTDVPSGDYGDPLAAADPRFLKCIAPQVAIATSHGINDAGMFELNFKDERFLPFEGAGAVSEWKLDMPRANNQFDLASVADVILHVRYTARQSGSSALTTKANQNLAALLPSSGLRMLVLNQDLSNQWHHFLHPDPGQDQTLRFTFGLEHAPFYVRGKQNIRLTGVTMIVEGVKDQQYSVEMTTPGQPVRVVPMKPDPVYAGRQSMQAGAFVPQAALLGDWQLKIQREGATNFKSLPVGDLANAYLVLSFSAT